MPAVARGDAVDTANTVHVSTGDADPNDGIVCDAAPQSTATEECSDDVFTNSIGTVREGDVHQAHTIPPACATHQTPLAAHSPDVYVNGHGMGRLGDTYSCGTIILSGSPNVFANGG